jgi:hypothetical protein
MAAQETSAAAAEAASLLAARDKRFEGVWPKLSLQEKNTIGQPGYDFFNKLAPKIRHSFPKESGSDAEAVDKLFRDHYTERGYGAKLLVPLRAIGADELVKLELPELEVILEPWLSEKTLGMIYAKRGVGKTYLMIWIACAVASGTAFLGWRPRRPRGVLFVDGENSVQMMQKRIGEFATAHGEIPPLLRVITPDLQDQAMPDLATAAGQALINEQVTPDTALIIIDNLSCLVRSGGNENESESWAAVAEWALAHRRAGRAVLFVHHAGKSGAQRGTSKREDLLDVVINLRHPAEYHESDGASFELRFEKARSLTGADVEHIEVRLETRPDGTQAWSYGPAATATAVSIKSLWEVGGMTLIDVARELGINKSTAARALQKAMDNGELTRPYPSRARANAAKVAGNLI